MPDSYRIILKKRVAADLERIFTTIAKSSPQAGPAFIGRVLDSIDSLQTFPHRNVVGGQDPTDPHPIRSLPIYPYLIFFRVIESEKVVRILRVRHGARRPLKRFD